jgi:Tol biopolymer transport system component
LGTLGEPSNYLGLRVSPDGSRVAAVIADQANAGLDALWVLDASTGARTRLTFNPGQVRGAAWSEDGKRIAYSTEVSGQGIAIVAKPADGSQDAADEKRRRHRSRPPPHPRSCDRHGFR